MSSPAPLPLTERVMQVVRASSTGCAREEVEEQLPDVDRNEVRAALKTLRNAHHLDAIAEGSSVLYRAPEYNPARQEGSSLARAARPRPALNLVRSPAPAPVPAAPRVVRFLGEDEAEPTLEDEMPKLKPSAEAVVAYLTKRPEWIKGYTIAKECGLKEANAFYHLKALSKRKAIQVRGKKGALEYAALGVPADAAPANETTKVRVRVDSASVRVEPTLRRRTKAKPAAPAPAALSAFALTLHVDLPDCKGTMTLDQAREFAAFVGTVTGGA